MTVKYSSYNDCEVVDLETGKSERYAEVYCTAEEFKRGVPTAGLPENTPGYITDWKTLNDSTKSELVSRIHMLQKDGQWKPQ